MSGSFESVRWNACVHRLDLGLYSHPKEFWGNGVRTHVNSKGIIPPPPPPPPSPTGNNSPRGGLNPRRYIKQDSEPNTLPMSYSGPDSIYNVHVHVHIMHLHRCVLRSGSIVGVMLRYIMLFCVVIVCSRLLHVNI